MGFFSRKNKTAAVSPAATIEPVPSVVVPEGDDNELIAVIAAAVCSLIEAEKQSVAAVCVPCGPPAPFFLRPRKV